jgi:hypothetical protein
VHPFSEVENLAARIVLLFEKGEEPPQLNQWWRMDRKATGFRKGCGKAAREISG